MRQKNRFHLDLHKVGKDKVSVEVSSNLNQWENVLKKPLIFGMFVLLLAPRFYGI